MMQTRFWRLNVLLRLLPVLFLVLTGVSAQAQPATGKAKKRATAAVTRVPTIGAAAP